MLSWQHWSFFLFITKYMLQYNKSCSHQYGCLVLNQSSLSCKTKEKSTGYEPRYAQ
jgi:hypothetical protein